MAEKKKKAKNGGPGKLIDVRGKKKGREKMENSVTWNLKNVPLKNAVNNKEKGKQEKAKRNSDVTAWLGQRENEKHPRKRGQHNTHPFSGPTTSAGPPTNLAAKKT